jgi:hypothetical protein
LCVLFVVDGEMRVFVVVGVCCVVYAGMCLKYGWVCERASPIAQLVERVAVNRKVAGSNPAGREASPFIAYIHRQTSLPYYLTTTPRIVFTTSAFRLRNSFPILYFALDSPFETQTSIKTKKQE